MEKGTKLLEGSIWKGVVAFAIPLFLGNLFQQLYNTVDSLIVGNFLGSDALAAVSSSGSLIFLLVGFFNGIAVGAGVVISKYFGARDYENLKKAVHTDVAFGLVSGLLLTVIGMFWHRRFWCSWGRRSRYCRIQSCISAFILRDRLHLSCITL